MENYELTSRDKTIIIKQLRGTYRLTPLLGRLGLKKSTYHYNVQVLKKGDPYEKIRPLIREIYNTNYRCFGSRRIHSALLEKGIVISEKVVRRLMKEEGLEVRQKKTRSYNSYMGEISPAPDDKLQHNFKADRPNEKWVSDITEFRIPAGKVYLSPLLDCFDGMPITWTIGPSPNAHLTETMLDQGITQLKEGETPILHTDRGAHYRWDGWIERTEKAGIIRSMSRKGRPDDNSACEGFFGHVKTEFFYNWNWKGVSIEEFKERLNEYLIWYREVRPKSNLGYQSPMEYRQKLGLLA